MLSFNLPELDNREFLDQQKTKKLQERNKDNQHGKIISESWTVVVPNEKL